MGILNCSHHVRKFVGVAFGVVFQPGPGYLSPPGYTFLPCILTEGDLSKGDGELLPQMHDGGRRK